MILSPQTILPLVCALAVGCGTAAVEEEVPVQEVAATGIAALDEMVSAGERGDGMTLGDTLATDDAGPSGHYEVAEMRRLLATSINRMPEREKLVLTLYYYEGLTLADIGDVLGVTESRVCQIHTKAVLHLRSRLSVADRVS